MKAALTTVPGYVALRRVPAPETFGRFALPRFPCPHDRGHLAHLVGGLARLREHVRRGTYPRPNGSFTVDLMQGAVSPMLAWASQMLADAPTLLAAL